MAFSSLKAGLSFLNKVVHGMHFSTKIRTLGPSTTSLFQHQIATTAFLTLLCPFFIFLLHILLNTVFINQCALFSLPRILAAYGGNCASSAIGLSARLFEMYSNVSISRQRPSRSAEQHLARLASASIGTNCWRVISSQGETLCLQTLYVLFFKGYGQ